MQTVNIPANRAQQGDLIVAEDAGPDAVVGLVSFFDHAQQALRVRLDGEIRWSWHASRGFRVDMPTLPIPQALRGLMPGVRLGRMLVIRRNIR